LLRELEQFARLPNVLAIGECGLDRICQTDWDLQTDVFRRQIEVADNLSKPLVIHCVRAFDELIKIIDNQKPKIPVIIHGFNRKSDIAERLWGRGMYLSFGAAILRDGSPAADALKHAPADKFFLETDNADIPISDIYSVAATIREISREAVILHLQQNFATVFKYNK